MTGTTPPPPHREIVLHVSDTPEDVSRAVAAGSALSEADPATRVRIIVNGAALDGVTDSPTPVTLGEGVTVEACQVGLRHRGLAEHRLRPGVGTVASAVVSIAEAQRGGALYIRI